jgi:hypothetical protein
MDGLAASVFAAGTAVSLFLLGFSPAVAASASAVALFASLTGLRAIAPEPELFDLPPIATEAVPVEEPDELLLTEVYRAPAPEAGELLLEDVLEKLGPQSRVVRLFDPSAMPTPGQLQVRIDRHLGADDRPTQPADASQALHQALAELRRSLR